MQRHRSWLRIGSVAALVGAAAAIVAAVAGGITEPTGVATVAAVTATVVAYGLAPLVITVAMRQSALSSWWAVAAALLAAVMWCAAGLLFAAPALLPTTTGIIDTFVSSAPSASALWILVASVVVARLHRRVRRGLHRRLGPHRAQRLRHPQSARSARLGGLDGRRQQCAAHAMSPIVARTSPAVVEPCPNCGAPRRTDGLAFCSSCGLPYGVRRT